AQPAPRQLPTPGQTSEAAQGPAVVHRVADPHPGLQPQPARRSAPSIRATHPRLAALEQNGAPPLQDPAPSLRVLPRLPEPSTPQERDSAPSRSRRDAPTPTAATSSPRASTPASPLDPLDPDLERSLTTVLRNAARRHGIEV
ncbi:hypothetical protein PPSIR1_14700, partial [Plesiocystis pacifica SIR-1]